MNDRVLNLIVSHQPPVEIGILLNWWRNVCDIGNILVAYGGTRQNYENLKGCASVFVRDPRLTTKDHQREKQSYGAIFRGCLGYVRSSAFTHVYFCEYDQVPLISDLNQRQLKVARSQNADVMGHHLTRVDGTGSAHYLYHESDAAFGRYWQSVSVRADKTAVLSMLGTGSFWTREAFLAVAEADEPIDAYVELYLPTLAHHKGFRIRPWGERDSYVKALPDPSVNIGNASRDGAWTVHPVKSSEAVLAPQTVFGDGAIPAGGGRTVGTTGHG